jgi:hypothetical protein
VNSDVRSQLTSLLSTEDDAPGVRARLDLLDEVRNELIESDDDEELLQWVEELMSMPPLDPMWMASFESFVASFERHFADDV